MSEMGSAITLQFLAAPAVETKLPESHWGRDHATADRFASHHSLARFDGPSVEIGPRGLPTLRDAIAVLYANVVDVAAAGDHYLITGEAFDFCNNGGVPLIRHQSRYTQPGLE